MDLQRSRTTPAWASDQTEEHVEQLLSRMTLDEKIEFVTGEENWNYGFYARPLKRLWLPPLQMADGPAGVRVNKGDVHGGRATALPAPIALAATWDPALAHQYGTLIGVEAEATGHNVSLGPAVDIARVPLGGRTFESYGEDPRLTSEIGVAYVLGVQAQGVQACAKHFAINNQEDHRNSIDAVIDERSMRELYLQPFEALIDESGVASLMAAFNRVNGEFACESPTLLTEILRNTFGFRGWVMSDYGANHSTAPSANAGLDQEQPGEGYWGGQLLQAVQNGEVTVETIDDKVRNILRPLVGLGQLDSRPEIREFDEDEHHQVAQRIAEAAMVLLSNDGVLPLSDVHRIALIGPDVDSAGAQGGGSSQVRGTRDVSPSEGLARAFPDAEIGSAHGVDPITPGVLLEGPDAVPSAFLRTPDGDRGLRAEFWTNTDLGGEPFLVRTEGRIELNLGFHNFPGFNASSPRYPALPTELNGRISVRWTGTLHPPTNGPYTFTVTSLGHFRLEIDDVTVASSESGSVSQDLRADLGGGQAAEVDELLVDPVGRSPYGVTAAEGTPTQHTVSLRLDGGRAYRLRLEYVADDPAQGHITGAKVRLGWVPPVGVISPDAAAAADLARTSDVAVVIARTYEAEESDRPHLGLPAGQNELIRAVLAANPRTVVVLMTGAPVDVTAWGAEPAALLQAWFPGQAQGDALARVLSGEVEPGGRLPLTMPKDLTQTVAADPRRYPGVDGRAHYEEGVFVGYRAVTSRGPQPAFPFGHGLGYTTFEYEDLEVASGNGTAVAAVSLTVRNTGGRAGSEVVQVYVGELPAPVPTPSRQLAAFRKVFLEPGRSERLVLEIPRRAVSYFDVDAHDWVVSAGDVDVLVGASSSDERLAGRFAL